MWTVTLRSRWPFGDPGCARAEWITRGTRVGIGAVIVVLALALIACGGDDDAADRPAGPRGMGADLLTPGVVATVVGPPTAATGRSAGAEGAESELCGDLGTFIVAVMDFRSLSASSTVNDLHAATHGIEGAWESLQRSADEDGQESVERLREAVRDFSRTGGNVPEGEPIGVAYTRLLAPLGEIELAVADVAREAGCP